MYRVDIIIYILVFIPFVDKHKFKLTVKRQKIGLTNFSI